jgi:uncharacterized membrane protein (UPF0182 family)
MEASSNAVIYMQVLEYDMLQYCIVFIIWLILFLVLTVVSACLSLVATIHFALRTAATIIMMAHPSSLIPHLLPSALLTLSSISSSILRKSYFSCIV